MQPVSSLICNVSIFDFFQIELLERTIYQPFLE